ncbi:hypothetical protein SO802_011936 [Lithocarpus litseifolius]|uniref:Uncharacterized protein n=1 Tax=Lithocarpus litseifolius TaxID=425828 RepID=A0AAW2D5G6_9ROSI
MEVHRGGGVAGEVSDDRTESEGDEAASGGDDTLESTSGALARPVITEEQEAFILKVTEIPLEERKCRDLITPDALHAYCGGPVPTEEARRLNNLSRQQMESAKLRAQIRAAAVRKKEEGKGKEGASPSLPKAVDNDAPKRKGGGTGDRPAKKQTVTLGDHPAKPRSPKHRARKGLMMA